MDKTRFDAEALRARLAGCRIGNRLEYRRTVDSTNRVARQRAREGAEDGTVILADRQTAGRGRLNRNWQSPPGCNLYLSVVLRPDVAPPDTSLLTLLAGVAVAEAIGPFCPAVGIKWPNDVRIRGRKVCGILTERETFGHMDAVIVGIGLNVNIAMADFAPGHCDTATSLREETGREHSREELVVLLCEGLERWYGIFLRQGFAPVRDAWLARSEMTGRHVRILFGDEVQEGVVTGIDCDGALLITDGQQERRITAGEATILRE